MNYTPEPGNGQAVPATRPSNCPLCSDVTVAQHRCICTAPCGHPRGCYYVEPEAFVPPPVPRFRKVDS